MKVLRERVLLLGGQEGSHGRVLSRRVCKALKKKIGKSGPMLEPQEPVGNLWPLPRTVITQFMKTLDSGHGSQETKLGMQKYYFFFKSN